MFLAFTAGGAAGPIVFATMRAQSGNDQAAMWIAAAACAVATILVLMIRDADLPFIAHRKRAPVDGDDAILAKA